MNKMNNMSRLATKINTYKTLITVPLTKAIKLLNKIWWLAEIKRINIWVILKALKIESISSTRIIQEIQTFKIKWAIKFSIVYQQYLVLTAAKNDNSSHSRKCTTNHKKSGQLIVRVWPKDWINLKVKEVKYQVSKLALQTNHDLYSDHVEM